MPGKSKFWLYALRACWERGEQTVYVSDNFVRFDSRTSSPDLADALAESELSNDELDPFFDII